MKLKEKNRESKDNRNFSHSRSGGGNRSQGNSSNEIMVHKFQSGGKSLRIECLENSNACFGCGKRIIRYGIFLKFLRMREIIIYGLSLSLPRVQWLLETE